MIHLLLASLLTYQPKIDKEPQVDTSYVKRIEMEEVTVTGFKQDYGKASPMSVTSLNNRFLRYNDIRSIKEISALLPNFFMPDYGSKQGAPIFIRGIGSRTNAPSVGLYIDGVPHFERSAFDIDMADVSNMEILRGPQGTLYGRNTIGGLINVYTHSPLDYQNTRIRLSYGSRNDIQATASTHQRIAETLGISLMGNYAHNDGFLTNIYNGEKADKSDNASFRTRLVWKPADAWTANLSLSYDYTRQNGFPYGKYDKATGITHDVNYNGESRYNRNLLTIGFGARYNGKHFSFNSQTAYQYINDRLGVDQDFTPQSILYADTRNKQHMYTQEFTFKSTKERGYHWIIGAFGFHQRINNRTEVSYLSKGFSLPKYYEIPTVGFALYHQSTLDIWRGLSVSAGVRFDYEHGKDTFHGYRQATGGTPQLDSEFVSKLTFRQLTPKLSLQYRFSDQDIVYTSMTRGYKTGGFNITFTKDEERTFKPEYNWNYEVGAKMSLFGGRVKTEVGAFYIDWRDQQFSQVIPGKGNLQRNAGHSVSKGVEASVLATPFSGLSVQVNYGYTHVKFLEYQKDEKTSYAGNYLPLVPRHTLAVHTAYTLYKVGRIFDRLTFSSGLTGAGPFYWNETNTTKQDLYFLLNAKISASKGRFTYEVWGKNLTDTQYLSYQTISGLGDIAQKGKPLAVGVSFICNL